MWVVSRRWGLHTKVTIHCGFSESALFNPKTSWSSRVVEDSEEFVRMGQKMLEEVTYTSKGYFYSDTAKANRVLV